MSEGIWIYFLAINGAGFIICFLDKQAAVHHRWRVPEKHLFLLGIAGGGIGLFAAMLLFRHKTRHASFMIGVPLLIILNLYVLMRVMERIGS